MIIQECLDSGENRELWEKVNLVFSHFIEADMSSDETDTEPHGWTPKTLRRVRKVWIDESISRLWLFVDQNYNPRSSTGLQKAGGKPLRREWESSSVNSKSLPRPKLPRNFYNHTIKGEKLKSLEPEPLVELPAVRPIALSLSTVRYLNYVASSYL